MMDDFGLQVPEHKGHRNLTDDDVKALADELENRVVDRFYRNLGRGVWTFAWRGIVLAVIIFVAVGTIKSKGG